MGAGVGNEGRGRDLTVSYLTLGGSLLDRVLVWSFTNPAKATRNT